jgi:diguanylate cyclase (GGDEF)-like protein
MLLYAVGAAFILLTLAKERTVRLHKTAAMTDPLTGLYNRRGLIDAAAELIRKTGRNAKPVTVLMFDLDCFKSINDRFGHAVGDEALKLFAEVARTRTRVTDFVGRLGGEEFAAIIPGAVEDGVIVAERIRVAFETAARTVAGHYLGATVSVGVATREPGGDINAALAKADTALYAAKANGRTRI